MTTDGCVRVALGSSSVAANREGVRLLHHIAIFRFKEGIAAGEIAAIRKDLLDLPDKVDSIRSNSFAKIAGMLGLAFIPANS